MLPLVMALGKHSVRLQWHLVKLQVAALIDTFCPPHPANVLSCGRGVEALLLAILDGQISKEILAGPSRG